MVGENESSNLMLVFENENDDDEAIAKPVDDRIDDPKSESNQEHNVI